MYVYGRTGERKTGDRRLKTEEREKRKDEKWKNRMNGKEKSMSRTGTGYLDKDFRMFHLKDKSNLDFNFHFHDFLKMIIFISGDVKYMIEGRSYVLEPWDILLITNNVVHKPIISPDNVYERIIFYIKPEFLEKHKSDNFNLAECFDRASKTNNNLIRLNVNEALVKNLVYDLENSYKSKLPGSGLLSNAIFIQLMVHINRMYLDKYPENMATVFDDELSGEIIGYLNRNLHENLTIEKLARIFHVNKYYLMHRFKKYTGYTVYGYLKHKRLLAAKSMLDGKTPISDICEKCGFNNYSSFIRAFKEEFGLPPKQYYSRIVLHERRRTISGH